LHRQGFQITLTQAGRDVSGLAWLLEGWVAIAIAGALGARWPSRAATAAVVWLLPAQAMVGSMVYNETVTDLGVGLVVLGVTLWARNQSWGLVWLGLGLPLAGLAKYSGLDALVIAVPLAIAVRPDRWTLTVLALLPGGALTAAYYIRNLIALGTPLPLNADIFDLKNWDPIRWGHPSGYFTNLSLAGCAAPDSFVGGFWKWFWGIDCSFQNLPSGPWSEQLPAWLVVVGGATSLFVLAATVLAVIGVRREPATILLTAIPMLTMIAFIYFNLRVPSATTDKGLYLLPALIPMAVAAGLLLDRLTPGSWVRLGYAAVMTWAMAMAAVSGVGP
ncbi:MAG TPA: hypothetical protein VG015_00555, partial [Candidatus Dormibacteraeota bacterium]|nr:hypothetical protein [Candidatus Dormibacteraeota bacterium]